MTIVLIFALSYLVSKILDLTARWLAGVLQQHPIPSWPLVAVSLWRRRRTTGPLAAWLALQGEARWTDEHDLMLEEAISAFEDRGNHQVSWIRAANELVTVIRGNTVLNHLLDRAGTRRSFAIASAAIAPPLLMVGLAYLLLGRDNSQWLVMSAVHFGMGATCAWQAADLVANRGFLARRGRPLLSVMAASSMALLLVAMSDGATIGQGAPAINTSILLLVGSLVVGTVGDVRGSAWMSLLSRLLVLTGSLVLAVAEFWSMLTIYSTSPLYAYAVGLVAYVAARVSLREWDGLRPDLIALLSMSRKEAD